MKNFLLIVLLPLAAPALAQVSVLEYVIPRGHYVHDIWADAAPAGPVWFSAQREGELGILDPKSGKVKFVPRCRLLAAWRDRGRRRRAVADRWPAR